VIQTAIARAVLAEDLSLEQARAAMEQVLAGEATPAQIGALAVALRMKGETADEIAGMAQALRERVPPLRTQRSPLLDTCGTGGDNAGTFNISTTVALVVASCGVGVAKHGNRAVSSRTGSADVLLKLGTERAWVVHGLDGMDELTVFDRSHVAEVRDGHILEFEVDPARLGLAHGDPAGVAGGDAAVNAQRIRAVLGGDKGAARDIVLLNAAAALVVAGATANLEEGIVTAARAIDSGAATAKLAELAAFRG